MKRLGIWVLLGALCVSLVRMGLGDEKGENNQSLVRREWYGFVYRAPWNSEDQLTVIGEDTRGLLSVDLFDDAFVSRLSQGCYICFERVVWDEGTQARNPGVFDYQIYLKSKHMDVCMQAQAQDLTICDEIPVKYWLRLPGARFRAYARCVLYRAFAANEAALIQGIMTGDTGDLSETTQTAFRDSGLSHLMAVSGTHVMFILSPFRRLGRRRRIPYTYRNALLLIPLLLFWMMADYTPSVTRACISTGGILVARILKKPPDRLNFLFLSAGIQLLLNPYLLRNAGFLMSYGAALGIYLVLPCLEKKFPYCQRRQWRSLAAGVAVNLVLAPLMLYLFGTFSLCGLFLTLLASFPASLICGGGYLFCLLATLPGVSWFCEPIGSFLSAICHVLSKLAELGAKLPPPLGTVRLPGCSLWLLASVYGILILWLIPLRRKKKLVVGFGTFFLLVTAVRFCQAPVMKLLFIDVGQGAATLVQADGTVGLIDTGDGKTDLVSVLWAQGIRRLDFVILTHGHHDHIGGLTGVLDTFSPEVLYLSENEEDGLRQAKQAALDRGVRVYPVGHGAQVKLGDVCMDFMVCDAFFGLQDESGENNASLSVRLSCPYGSATVCGDLETDGIQELMALQAFYPSDVLYVPHHGSQSGIDEKMLSNIAPKYAIISVGAKNPYGHPSAETLSRLDTVGATVYRTDLCGGISVEFGPQTLLRRRCVAIWQTL